MLGNFDEKNVYYSKIRKKIQDMGLDIRLRQNDYPELEFIGSLHCETAYITSTLRSMGMPQGSTQNKFYKPPSRGTFQISSTSINDTSAGTGARTIRISGLYEDDNGNWIQTTENITLNGQSAVLTTRTNWIRINFMSVLTVGSTGSNQGAIYVSPSGTTLTSGLPNSNIISAIITNWNTSSMGDYSVPSNRAFVFLMGNFFFDTKKSITIRETYKVNNGITYQVGYYGTTNNSFNYFGASGYTAKSDIMLDIYIDTGTATNAGCYYLEYALVNTGLINGPLSEFIQ